jgi:hypothetical protein
VTAVTVAKPHIERSQRFVWTSAWTGNYEKGWLCRRHDQRDGAFGRTPTEAYTGWLLANL